ncbi:Vitamin B12 transport ATP-binding protein BacA [Synechococcus sp. MIT S9509]|uniref:ABC transporter ATP-binding protein/permease n=1 Tax=unclassified Synechococcus TaxID=2626047 RepID=UPI0007BB8E9A|nr:MULTISPECIES: ABC transporter ATP-binding protein/permease [unclassified Synechococcus]KZR84730.1 Vitamin B12 transport ATP-binding protein BacA [Synechococcus sp. MIT S9504]KZR89842.1 Vitamin B12 transport ATP-binding protein BacA [Synechococcus sp. MIT S9509]
MTTTPRRPAQGLGAQLGKLQRLAQPYFLPVEETRTWQFLLLVLSLLLVVIGVTLALLTAVVALSNQLIPTLQERFLPGVEEIVHSIWSGWIGPVVSACALAGAAFFIAFRSKLRQGRWLPWLLLGVIALLILVINGINVGISFIARNIENALVAYDESSFWNIVAIYAFCLVLALPIRAVQSYLIPKVGLMWRRWLSSRLLGRYLSNRAYYVLNPNDENASDIDNPDQRIADDTRSFTITSLSVVVEVITALLTFFSFILVLWGINGRLAQMLIVYSVVGTTLIVYASRKLVALNYQQLKLEADFRYGLVHIRDNAESIAFYGGEKQEGKEANRRLDGAITNYNRLIIWEALISVIQRSYDYFSRFLPWLVIAPIYFAKEVDFGVFGQASIAFSQVLFSVSYIVNNIDRLAAFSASISRLEGFQGRVDEITHSSEDDQLSSLPNVQQVEANRLLISHVDLVPPQSDRVLIKDLSISLEAGQRLLVVGPSGCGKTSFLRLASGLWPVSGDGHLERPPAGDMLFIPQKPYMLLGSLREQLAYPLQPDRFDDDQFRSVLQEVRLPDLVNRYPDLDVKQDWPRLLSLGEQQRLAFARLLLNAPHMLVLDEATSALDVSTERHLYELLCRREISFISVGHRPTLREFHDTVLELDGKGGWRLLPAAGYEFGRV